jgi:large subunit ribosomal protein L10
MAITKQKKQEVVKDLAEKIEQAKGVVFANFEGLSVPEMEELREKCDQAEVSVDVVKKTLLDLAAQNIGANELNAREFSGGVAVFVSREDEVAPAKAVAEFGESHEAVNILAGIMDSDVIDRSKVLELAKLPSKEELYAKLVGSVNAPVTGFVNVLAGNMRGLVNVLNGIKESKE